MPIYSYKCNCGEAFDRLLRLVQYQEPQNCPTCGSVATKILTPVAVIGDYAAYDCPITGKIIEGRKAHKENLQRHGCRLLEPGETQSVIKQRAASDESFAERVAETAAAEVASWSSAKQERLASELAAGADIKVVRQTVQGVNHG